MRLALPDSRMALMPVCRSVSPNGARRVLCGTWVWSAKGPLKAPPAGNMTSNFSTGSNCTLDARLELDWEEDADGEEGAEEQFVLGRGAEDGV